MSLLDRSALAAAPEPALQPWAVSDSDFPYAADTDARLRFLLRYAILAPSGHNTQPWRFRIEDGTVELRADRARSLPVVDPEDRELTISCGAALETLIVALRHFSLRGVVRLAPDPADADLLARVSVETSDPPDRDDDELFAAITRRHSNRQTFADRAVPRDLTDRLVADAEAAGAALRLVAGSEQRAAVADLVSEGDRVQMADKHFRRELAAWVHPNRSRARDGMRAHGFGIGDLASYGGPFVIRSFDRGDAQAATDRELAVGSPLLGVFVTEADDPSSWLRCGRALQRVLLRARADGVWCSHLNQPVEVAALRPRLAVAIGRPADVPQLVVRFGYGDAPRAQPRRAVGDVIAS